MVKAASGFVNILAVSEQQRGWWGDRIFSDTLTFLSYVFLIASLRQSRQDIMARDHEITKSCKITQLTRNSIIQMWFQNTAGSASM